jgi:hypothetical protein
MNYGIDPDGPAPAEEWDGQASADVPVVEIPPTDCPLLDDKWLELKSTIDPTRNSDCNGVDIYIETIHFIQNAMH